VYTYVFVGHGNGVRGNGQKSVMCIVLGKLSVMSFEVLDGWKSKANLNHRTLYESL